MKRIVVALACLWAVPVIAEPMIRPPDEARLDGFEAALGASLRNALAEGAAEDVRTLASVLAGMPGDFDPEGAWSCRTIKLGGAPALTVYGAFRCRIEAADGGWRLVKETGSQRLDGRILRDDDQWLYLGVGFVDGGPGTAVDKAHAQVEPLVIRAGSARPASASLFVHEPPAPGPPPRSSSGTRGRR